ncbi:putative M23-family peptidase [Actinoplanes missouriensis 431]|uniref:Putative M23-family peptidase n=1 Tax=Actinoplanes missouriensis (strain ATCC 14538 / DSM 43046 / CBS 188.64 / JCM 3121 / NBRC 102363 / NCIMB 12654 / NRRL B-3342 / UNCC 431) TaxID=512565 RepID=I0HJ96_ACTM4|nr:M23 family metallopeptidase [Actinoplanes missouriensis]BAL93083.1 putative M23-family peptidase [Actinoplanes missouriensis 431]
MRFLRTLSGLTLTAACLAGCGGAAGAGSPAATPHFVEPASAAAPAAASAPTAGTPAESPATAASPATEGGAAATSASAAPKAGKVKYVFPVDASNVDFHTTHSKYPATDLFVDCGERFVATTSGVVLEISLSDKYVKGRPDGPNNGGLSVSLLGDDGVRYYGSHLSKVQSGIEAGVRVEAGQLLGRTGKTGNANNVCHVHYGISPPCAETGDWKVRRGVIWPATFLTSWRKGGQKSPVATVEAWEKKNGCKA